MAAYKAAESRHKEVAEILATLGTTYWTVTDEITAQITAAEKAKADAEARAAGAGADATLKAVSEAEAKSAEAHAAVLRKLQADHTKRFADERKELEKRVQMRKDEMDAAKKRADAEVKNSKITHILLPTITAEQVKAKGSIQAVAAETVERLRMLVSADRAKEIIINDADMSGAIGMVLAGPDIKGDVSWAEDYGKVHTAVVPEEKKKGGGGG